METTMVAPDFELPNVAGGMIRLSDYREKKNVVLVLLRGFLCPYCRAQLARLRDAYENFRTRGAEILVVGPDSPEAFRRYWEDKQLPFPGLPDPRHVVSDLYGQQVNLLKLGRMPALVLVDRVGQVQYRHYGNSMADVADTDLILRLLDHINQG